MEAALLCCLLETWLLRGAPNEAFEPDLLRARGYAAMRMIYFSIWRTLLGTFGFSELDLNLWAVRPLYWSYWWVSSVASRAFCAMRSIRSYFR